MQSPSCILNGQRVSILPGSHFYIDGSRYVVKRDLHEPGDDPAFATFQLSPADGAAAAAPVYAARFPAVTETEAAAGAPKAAGARRASDPFALQRDLLQRMRGLSEVPQLRSAEVRFGESGAALGNGVLLLDFVHGMLLSEWMRRYEAALPTDQRHPQGVFQGIRELPLWFRLASKLIGVLVPVHNERLVHGDLRPRNITFELPATGGGSPLNPTEIVETATIRLLNTQDESPRLYPADGTCAIRAFDPAIPGSGTGTFRRRYDSPLRLFEEQTGKGVFVARETNAQWFAPTDIFSLGIILFELACGTSAELGPFLTEHRLQAAQGAGTGQNGPVWYKVGSYEVRQTNRQLKTSLLKAWKRRMEQLDLPQTAETRTAILRMSEVILACLRSHTDAHVADLLSIQSICEEFDPQAIAARRRQLAHTEAAVSPPDPAVKERVQKFFAEESAGLSLAMRHLVLRRGNRLAEQMKDLMRSPGERFLRVNARPAIVDTIVTLLLQMRPPDSCCALLTATFFSDRNLGVYGRVVSALQLAALAGVKVEWNILIKERNLQSREVAEVLHWQKVAACYVEPAPTASDSGRYGVHYTVVSSGQYDEVLRKQLTSIVLCTQQGSAHHEILIAPDYHGEGGEIAALRIWPRNHDPDPQSRHQLRRAELLQAFADHQPNWLHVTNFHS
ncbi:MAG TPA: hypothetical protein VGD62_07155 [Acidobacteriaceae bacterium]